MPIRYVISHINKDEMRCMTYACQGRETRGSKEEAQKDLQDFLTNNTEERLAGVFGSQAIGTFEVSAIECYPNHFDPMGPVIRESLNPGQVCVVGDLKKILEQMKGSK